MKRSVFISLLIALVFLVILGSIACDVQPEETTLDEVKIVLSETGISFSYSDHTTFEYSSDGGAFFELDSTTSIFFSDDAGEHTIVINAVDPEDPTVILATGTYTYRTVTVSLPNLTVNGLTASWDATAYETYLKVGSGEFVSYAESSYTATDPVRISVKAVTGFDAEAHVYYGGKNVTRSATLSSTYNALSSPVISVNDGIISWNRVENATGYEVSTDGEEYYAADQGAFSSEVGSHVFRVKALGDLESHLDSEPSELRYTTTATSIAVTKSASDSASFLYTGLALTRKVRTAETEGAYAYKNGYAYYKVGSAGYTASFSGTVTFVAMSGYDQKRSVYYPEDSSAEVPFTVIAATPFTIDARSSWHTPATLTDGVEMGEKYDGAPCVLFRYAKDGSSYAYSSALRIADGYDYVSFEAKGDALASVTLRFTDTKNGYSLSYPLGVLPDQWMRISLSIEQEGWLVNDAMTITELLAAAAEDPSIPAKYRALRSASELLACFDTFEVVLSAAAPDEIGQVALSAVVLSYSDGLSGEISQPLFHRGTAYVLFEETDDQTNEVYLRIEEDAFLLYSTSLARNFYLTGTASFDEAAATLRLVCDGFSLSLLYTHNGYCLTGDVGEGEAAEYLNGKTLRLASDSRLTFEDGTAGEAYESPMWTTYYKSPSSDSFEPTERPILFVETLTPADDASDLSAEDDEAADEVISEGDLVLSLRTAYAEVDRFVYNEIGRSLGMANAFTLMVSASSSLQLRVVAVAVDGTEHFLIGASDTYYTLAPTEGFVELNARTEAVELRSFYIEVYNATVRNAVSLLISEIVVSYVAEVSANSQYPLPVILPMADHIEFSYDIQGVAFEYSLDTSKDFTDGERGDVFFVSSDLTAGEHVLYVRALIGEEEIPSKAEKYTFTVYPVTVSSIAVRIGDDGNHTATWSTNGDCFTQVTKTVATFDPETGDPVTTEEIVEAFKPTTSFSYVAKEDVTLAVKAEGHFDANSNAYYVGTILVQKKIRVTENLDAPVLSFRTVDGVEGIGWDAVDGADHYSVQVNNAEPREQKECFFPFESGGSAYVVKIISIDEDGIAYSNVASFSYRVVPIDVEALTLTDLTFSGKAVGRYAFFSEKNKEESPLELGAPDQTSKRAFSFTVAGEGVHVVTVRIVAGYDEASSVLYVGEDLMTKGSVNISRIPSSVISVYMDGDVTGLTWKKAFSDGETGYRLEERVNGGEWKLRSESMVTEYPFPSVPGEYAIRVSAIGDGVLYLNSASVEYSFTVRATELAPVAELSADKKKVTLTIGSVALLTEINEGYGISVCKDAVREYTDTTTVTISAEGGFDVDNKVFYAGKTLTWEQKLIVPIPLSAPVPYSVGNGVYWQNGRNVEFYLVTLEKYNEASSAYEVIRDKERVTVRVGADSSFAFEKENKQFVTGKYRMTILASNSDLVQYPNDDAAAVFLYEVRTVSVTDPIQEGNIVHWTYDAYSLDLYVNDVHIVNYGRTSYVNDSGRDCTVRLTVAGGYDDDAHILYIDAAESKTVTVSYSQLLTPTLVPMDTGLVWEAVNDADTYEVTVWKGQEAPSVAVLSTCVYTFPSEVGSYSVSIRSVDSRGSFTTSDPAVFTFEVKAVYLSEIAERVTGKTSREAYWTKVGKTAYSTDGATYEPTDLTVYSPKVTTHYYVKCSPGFVSNGEASGVYYHGEAQSDDYLLVIPIFLKAPTLTLTASGIDVSGVDSTEGVILKVSHDGVNSDMPASTTLIPNSVTAGSHTITVTAYHSDEKQYPATDASCTLTYTVKEVALSIPDSAYVVDEMSFTANGIVTVSEAGELTRTYADTDSYVYTPSASAIVTVTAAKGLDTAHACYYVGENVTSSSIEVIIPIPLRAPTLTKTKDGITVSTVEHADGYTVRYSSDNGATWQAVAGNVVQNGKIVYGDVITESGSYVVEVRPYSSAPEPERYPSVETSVATVAYDVDQVSLSALTTTNNVVSWTATACEVRIKVSTKTSSGSYVLTTDSSYTCAEAGEYSISVRAIRGYKESANTYYHLADETITKGPVSVTITKLASPTVSGSASGISWTAVSGAKGYKVRVNNGSYENTSGTTKSFSTTKGTYKVEVIALGDDKTLLSSDAASYTYSVESVTLSGVTTSGRKASWTAVALKVSYKVNSGSYATTTASSYTLPTSSTAGTYTISVKAEGGFSNDTYYYCASPIEKSGVITLTKLATPTLTGSASGIAWTKVSGASSYQSKTDSENYVANSSLKVSLSSSEGSHTVKVKAIASTSGANVDSDEATFTYTTKKPTISFIKESDTEVAFKFDGLKAQYSTDNGSSWKDSTYPGYTASSTSTVKFRAAGGYLADARMYYTGSSSVLTKSFSFSGQLIDNFETGAVSAWKKEKYTTSWSAANDAALEIVPDSAGGGSAVKLTSFANGSAYKITRSIGTMNTTYHALAFDIRVNRFYPTVKTILQVQDLDSGIYIQYPLSNLSTIQGSDNWYHVVISFDDKKLEITVGGKVYDTETIKSYISKTQYKTWDNAIKAMDDISFIISGTDSSYSAIYTYIDNIRLLSSGSSSATKLTTAVTNLEFNDGTAWASYTNSKWKKYEWANNAYQASTKDYLQCQLDRTEGAQNKVLSMYCGYNAYKYTYNEGGSNLGTANHLSIDLASWTSGTNVNYRIILIDGNNKEIFLAGSSSGYATLTPTAKPAMQHLSFNFSETTVKSIVIIAQCSANANLFADNIYLSKSSVS